MSKNSNPEICEICKRQLTALEMDKLDKDLARICHQCLDEVIDNMINRGEIHKTADNKIALTKKGVRTALKECDNLDKKTIKLAKEFLEEGNK